MAEAQHRFPVFTHVSPKAGDVLFYIVVDRKLPKYRSPEYGTPYPGKDYPNHELVFVEPHDAEGMERWFYAADREDQAKYNWDVSFPYNGLTNAPRYDCVFLLRRDTYEPVEKGTKHPLDEGDDTPTEFLRFKGAKLVFETEVTTGNDKLDSLFIAVRRIYDRVPSLAEQLIHNIEKTFPYGGLRTNPRFTRTLILPRQDFQPLVKESADLIYQNARLFEESEVNVGDQIIESLYILVQRKYDAVPSMAQQDAYNASYDYPYQANEDYPRTLREYVVLRSALPTLEVPLSDPDDIDSVYAFKRVTRFNDSLDSIYVKLEVAYDRIPNLTDEEEFSFLRSFGYRVTRPYGTSAHLRLVWRIPHPREDWVATPEYESCPVNGFTSLLLTDETMDNPVDNPASLALVRTYDAFPGPAFAAKSLDHNANIPNQFIRRREMTVSSQPVQNSAGLPAVGGSPIDGVGATMSSNVGPSGNNQVIHQKGDTFLKLTIDPLEGWSLDPETGLVLRERQEIVPAGTAGSDVDANGNYSEITPINPFFSIKTTRKSTGLAGNTRSYQSVVNYSWPAVLRSIQFFAVEAHRDGVEYLDRFGYDYTLKEGYSGPCNAVITESWSKTPIAVSANAAMMPEGMSFDFPLTRGFSIPSCLHPSITITEVIGTNHPKYVYTTTTKTFPATNYVDWPAAIVASYTQTPYRGGFKAERILVSKPS